MKFNEKLLGLLTLTALSSINVQAQDDVQKLKEIHNRYDDHLKQLKQNIIDTQSNIELYRKLIDDSKKELAPLEDRVARNNKIISEKRADANKLPSWDDSKGTLQSQANVIEANNRNISTQIQSIKDKIAEGQQGITKNTNQLEEFKKTYNAVKNSFKKEKDLMRRSRYPNKVKVRSRNASRAS